MGNLLNDSVQMSVIVCKNANNEIIGVYESIPDAAEDFFIEESEIAEAISTKKQLTGSGFWSRGLALVMKPDSEIATEISSRVRGKHKHPKASVSVVQLDYDTMAVVAKFHSMYEAFLKTGARNISKCCKGEAQSSGGYRWMYEDEYEEMLNDGNNNNDDLM